MLCSALAFATMGALAHGLRESTSWSVIALARSAVVLALSGALVIAFRVKLHFWRPWELWARSIAGSLSMLCIFFSLTRLPISIVLTVMNLAPVWVAIASWFLLPRARSKGVWVAIAVGLTGVVLIQQPQLARGNMAVLAPLASSFLLAVVMISLHRAQRIDARAVVCHYSVVALVASLCVFVFAAARSAPQVSTDWTAILMLIGTGVASTLGQLFLTLAFASGPPAKVSVVGLTQVGMAMLYDVGVWGHTFGLLSLLGIVLVVAPTGWLLYTER
jgi:drug/metabolite transporter (DMT)-like permease